MSNWTQITSSALLGLGRSATQIELPSPLNELLTGSEAEARLLRACGILGTVGAAAQILPITEEKPPEPVEEETDSALSPVELASLTRRLIEDGRVPLVAEMCALLAKASITLPQRLLPMAFELGRKVAALRSPLREILGKRGAWLAAQNPEWSFALLAGREVADRSLWDEGDATQRAIYLRYLRQSDVNGARELLQATFAQETARDRAVLLPALGENLGMADEAFLAEILAEDRGKEVRQIAAALLSRLTDSTFAREITGWLAPCVRSEKKLFRTVTVIEPPATFDPQWKKKGLEEKPPASVKLGERGWWLYQLASMAPLVWWELHLKSGPADILGLAAKSDWKDALLGGFRSALNNQTGLSSWTLALLESGQLPPDEALGLALQLPPVEANQAFMRILGQTDDIAMAIRVIELADFPWSPELWKAIRKKLPHWLSKQDWRFRTTLALIACRVPVTCLQDELTLASAEFYADAIAEFSQIINQRRTLHHYLNP